MVACLFKRDELLPELIVALFTPRFNHLMGKKSLRELG